MHAFMTPLLHTRSVTHSDARSLALLRRMLAIPLTLHSVHTTLSHHKSWTDGMFDGVYRGKKKHDSDREQVLRRARSVGMRRIICTGTDLEESRRTLDLVRQHRSRVRTAVTHAGDAEDAGALPELYSTVGVHPTQCSLFEKHPDGPEAYARELRALAEENSSRGGSAPSSSTAAASSTAAPPPAPAPTPAASATPAPSATTPTTPAATTPTPTRTPAPASVAEGGCVVAIGEMGLDYERLQFCAADTQRRYLELQLREVATGLGLPLFLHLRGAGACADLCALLREYPEAWSAGAVVHSFDGSEAELRELLALGAHLRVGLNGCSVRSAENLAVSALVPPDRLLLESDAPWCDMRPTHASHVHVRTAWPSKRADRYRPHAEEGETLALTMVKGRNEPCGVRRVLEAVAGIHHAQQESFSGPTASATTGAPLPGAAAEVSGETTSFDQVLERIGMQVYRNTLDLFWPGASADSEATAQ
jgi:TatD DNase family protein